MYEGNNSLILSTKRMWKYLKTEEDGLAINYMQDYKSLQNKTQVLKTNLETQGHHLKTN